jgi:uncharacterized protein YeaO (DUF488 family)
VAVRVVRLGTPRLAGEGLRLGTVRRLPRGVKKADYAKRDYFDLWFPEIAPSQALLGFATAKPLEAGRWKTFEKRYRSEMAKPAPQRLLELLARLSHHADFSVGCYCEDEARCHRSILRKLLAGRGARIVTTPG